MEATGHYGDLLATFLFDKKIHTSVINPKCIKQFAISILARNKTDKQDAKVIAAYAKTAELREFTPKTEAQAEVRELTRTLEMLKDHKIQLENQLEATLTKQTKRFFEKMLKQLNKEIAAIKKND